MKSGFCLCPKPKPNPETPIQQGTSTLKIIKNIFINKLKKLRGDVHQEDPHKLCTWKRFYNKIFKHAGAPCTWYGTRKQWFNDINYTIVKLN
jgi:hypothetical protein